MGKRAWILEEEIPRFKSKFFYYHGQITLGNLHLSFSFHLQNDYTIKYFKEFKGPRT